MSKTASGTCRSFFPAKMETRDEFTAIMASRFRLYLDSPCSVTEFFVKVIQEYKLETAVILDELFPKTADDMENAKTHVYFIPELFVLPVTRCAIIVAIESTADIQDKLSIAKKYADIVYNTCNICHHKTEAALFGETGLTLRRVCVSFMDIIQQTLEDTNQIYAYIADKENKEIAKHFRSLSTDATLPSRSDMQ